MGNIRKGQEKTTKQITIRLTENFYNRLEAEAEIQNRPLANMIKAILVDYFETIDRAKNIANTK